MANFDLIIENGTIVDGTGAERFEASIGIKNGKIAQIGDLGTQSANQIIDAEGKIVAPGVIDAHTHYDAIVHWDPNCTNSSLHGATTVVVGNCGFGFSPCKPKHRLRYMQMMESTEQVPLSALKDALPWTWETFPEWMAYMRKLSLGINLASFLPLNSLMIYVMGVDAAKSRRASDAEMARMKLLLNEAMDCGAVGFGFSKLDDKNSHVDFDGTPMPTDTMYWEDAFALASVLKERGEGVIQCLGDLPAGVDHRDKIEELARISGRPVVHNVIAAFDMMPDWHKSRVDWVSECRERGLDIYSMALCFRAWNQFNVDDYNAWNTIEVFREFSTQAGKEAKLAKLRDQDYRRRLREQYVPEVMYAGGGPLESYLVHDVCGLGEFEQFVGKSVAEMAALQEKHVCDAFFDLSVATDLQAEFVTVAATSEDADKICEILDGPAIMAGTSDGGAHVKFYTGGQFSTDLIMWLVREEQRYTLEQLHNKLSALPAKVFSLLDRGTLEVNKAADIIIYDFDQLSFKRNAYDKAYDLPNGDWRRECTPIGMEWVIVNGEPLYHHNKLMDGRAGKILGV
jgi:N-acyl-D-aspartate/D-glutamate deacylase